MVKRIASQAEKIFNAKEPFEYRLIWLMSYAQNRLHEVTPGHMPEILHDKNLAQKNPEAHEALGYLEQMAAMRLERPADAPKVDLDSEVRYPRSLSLLGKNYSPVRTSVNSVAQQMADKGQCVGAFALQLFRDEKVKIATPRPAASVSRSIQHKQNHIYSIDTEGNVVVPQSTKKRTLNRWSEAKSYVHH